MFPYISELLTNQLVAPVIEQSLRYKKSLKKYIKYYLCIRFGNTYFLFHGDFDYKL